jgi:hypothetical protein
MADFQLRCVNGSTSRYPHERVISIGGVSQGQRCQLTQQAVVYIIEFVGNGFG